MMKWFAIALPFNHFLQRSVILEAFNPKSNVYFLIFVMKAKMSRIKNLPLDGSNG